MRIPNVLPDYSPPQQVVPDSETRRRLRVRTQQVKDTYGNTREVMHMSNGVTGFHLETGAVSPFSAMHQGITIRGQHVMAMAMEPYDPATSNTWAQSNGPWVAQPKYGIPGWCPIVHLAFLDENGLKTDPARITPDATKLTMRFTRWCGVGTGANSQPHFAYTADKVIACKVFKDVELDAGTAEAGALTTLTDSGKSWVTNVYAGALLWIYEGTGKGQLRTIRSNTDTVLTVDALSVAPGADSKYHIIPADAVLHESWRGDQATITGASNIDLRPTYRGMGAVMYDHTSEGGQPDLGASSNLNVRVWFYIEGMTGTTAQLLVRPMPGWQSNGVTSFGIGTRLWGRQGAGANKVSATVQGSTAAWAASSWNYIKMSASCIVKGTNMLIFDGADMDSATNKFTLGVHDAGVKTTQGNRAALLYNGTATLAAGPSYTRVVEQDVTLYRDQDKFDWVVRIPENISGNNIFGGSHGGSRFTWNLHMIQAGNYGAFIGPDREDAMFHGPGYDNFIPDRLITPAGVTIQPGAGDYVWENDAAFPQLSISEAEHSMIGTWTFLSSTTGRSFSVTVDDDGTSTNNGVNTANRNIDQLNLEVISDPPFYPEFSGTATGGSTTAAADTSTGDWQTDRFAGKYLWVMDTTDDAAPEGEVKLISGNTLNQINTTGNAFSAAIAASDTYGVIDSVVPDKFNDIVFYQTALVRASKYFFDTAGDQSSTLHVNVSGLVGVF